LLANSATYDSSGMGVICWTPEVSFQQPPGGTEDNL